MLTREQARQFYDCFGARQDRQASYEDPALADLVAHARFDDARAVFEFGCGTGRFARQLFDTHLGPDATYTGVDLAPTMVELARERLVPFASRATVHLVDGSPELDAPTASVDRWVSNYVFDLLPEAEIAALVAEAHRVLEPGGLLCVVGLTHGATLTSKLVTGGWRLVHRLRPQLVGGCRPLVFHALLDPARWRTLHHGVITAVGLTSEVVVASSV